MPPGKEPQLYLIHGNNEVDVNEARYGLVSKLLTPEERDSGLGEIRSAGNQPLQLDRCLNDIVNELGTVSFIAGARRVVVVYDMKDFYDAKSSSKSKSAKPSKANDSAKPKKRDRVLDLIDWFDQVLFTTENIAVFVCLESEEKGTTVAQDSELYRYIRQRGVVIEKKEKPIQWDFEDHLLSRNTAAAIGLLREWLDRAGSDSSSRLKIHSTITGTIELLLQARSLAEARKHGIPENQIMVATGFPSLSRTPPHKAKKLHQLAGSLSFEQLRELVQEANRLQRSMYPTGEEDYVTPWDEVAEMLTLRLTTIGSR